MTLIKLEEAKKVILDLWITKYIVALVVVSQVTENRGSSLLNEPQIVYIICLSKDIY
jgi:hypothetical protein